MGTIVQRPVTEHVCFQYAQPITKKGAKKDADASKADTAEAAEEKKSPKAERRLAERRLGEVMIVQK